MSFQQQFEVHDGSQLPSADLQHGFLKRRLSKPIALFRATSHPRYAFMATCTGIPQDIYAGQRLEFEVTIQPHSPASCSPDAESKVSLDSCTVTLIAQTAGPQPTHIEVSRQKQSAVRPAGPFSKNAGYRKTVDLGVLGHVPSTFNFDDVSRSYKLRLEIQFHVANHDVVMRREAPVVFYPPGTEAMAGSRRMSGGREDLPTYEEVMAGRWSTGSRASF